jgi:type IV pilus biogenesis protein CpaD/CtpE
MRTPDVLGESSMFKRAWLPTAAVIAFTLTAACGSNPKPQTPVTPTPSPAVVPAPVTVPVPDPIDVLIAASQSHFDAGEREVKMGHLERAREAFDRAVDVLLE